MQRPDLRQIAGNIREALGDCDRETLLDMLTFVFKEYVVEGPPPLLMSQSERVSDLEGLSFPALIQALQTRLDLPELGLFQVEGDQVLVRVGGVLTPLDPGRAGAAVAPAGRPPAGVRVVETQLTRPRPGAPATPGASAPAAPAAATSSARPAAPQPRRGLSVRGRPSEGAGGAPGSPGDAAGPPAASPPQPGPGGAAAGAPQQGNPPARESSPPDDQDSTSRRFSLLELD
ncbi:hypothetical protein [Haliangium sp.]|uniref:hypothetical protein n=1 Tax=Haliangium sp. TaxID=2663208 RepID=UPI003D0B4702